jgi:hypothetical protein
VDGGHVDGVDGGQPVVEDLVELGQEVADPLGGRSTITISQGSPLMMSGSMSVCRTPERPYPSMPWNRLAPARPVRRARWMISSESA